nr:putative integrase [Ipomoea batatas]
MDPKTFGRIPFHPQEVTRTSPSITHSAIPKVVWEDIAMDFIIRLPRSSGFDCIFWDSAHFVGLRHPFTAKSLLVIFAREGNSKWRQWPRNTVTEMKYFDNSATIWTEHNNKGGQCSTSPINNPAMHQPKLAPRYFGPFIIVRKLSTLSYKLALPATTKATHKQSGNTQVLVQWEGQPKDDTTWVDIADFRGQFPNSNLVHKVVSLAGSIDKERNQWIVYTRKW